MTGSTISTTVTNTVVLGNGVYPSPLTVTDTGRIAATLAKAAGVYASQSGVYLDNAGTISGANDFYGRNGGGGIGVDFTGSGTIQNAGVIEGGLGDQGNTENGVGILLASGGAVFNSGSVSSGNYLYYVKGGIGAELGSGATMVNTGTVSASDTGVSLAAAGYLSNQGSIAGSAAGVITSGANVVNASAGVINAGYVFGAGGGIGVSAQAATVTNAGTVSGGHAGNYSTAAGGTGIYLSDAVLSNSGRVEGGQGGGAYSGLTDADGGLGVKLTNGGTIDNSGSIIGGTDGYLHKQAFGAGGAGAELGSAGAGLVLNNSGLIAGGSNGATSYLYPGVFGGDGLVTASGNIVTNTGTILGGAGGASGGAGVYLAGTLTNDGVIAGGQGGAGHENHSGDGGDGVQIDGGTLVNAGTITAGAAGAGGKLGDRGTAGDAVSFGSIGGTLVLDPGAVINGLVVADSAVRDVLKLAGTQTGTITGMGTQYTGFFVTFEAAGAHWDFASTNTLPATARLGIGGFASVTGSLTNAGVTSVSGTLGASGAGVAVLDYVDLRGGVLASAAGAAVVVGTTSAAASLGNITVQADGIIGGFGTLGAGGTAGIVDNGLITVRDGAMALDAPVSGSARIVIQKESVLQANADIGAGRLVFDSGAGEGLSIAAGITVDSTVTGFNGLDVIDFLHRAATSLKFEQNTLILEDGSQTVGTLHFASGYTRENFALMSDGSGGTKITFELPAAAHPLGQR